MDIKKIEIEYMSDFQYKVLSALSQSFQEEGINFDKFLIWLMKETGNGGQSICLRNMIKES